MSKSSLVEEMLSVILTLVMIFCVPVHAAENNVSDVTIQEIDSLLREANAPESMIETMGYELKRMIYNNTLSKEDVEYINVKEELTAGNMARAEYNLSDDELKLSVIAFKVLGVEQVEICVFQ